MESTTMKVTPAMAEAWLNKNHGNRDMRPGVAEGYADDMRNGKWTECLDPIAFYENGDVANGQHRLWAIIESGKAQQFIVVRNFPRDAALNVDTGAKRTLVDNARISGEKPLSTVVVVAARAINDGKRITGHRTNAQKLEIVERYREAAEFAASHCTRQKFLGGGPMLGALGRAYMHEVDKDRLLRFCAVYRSGFMDNEGESAAVAIRNYLMTKGAVASTQTLWTDTFKKCQHAINAFMRGRPQTWVKTVKDEAYPIVAPENKPTKGRKGIRRVAKTTTKTTTKAAANGHAHQMAA